MSHTANAVDPATNTTAASLRVDATLAGYRELMLWSKQFGERRWAVENARGLGRHLAQWLVARGEVVLDVPCTATSRVRELPLRAELSIAAVVIGLVMVIELRNAIAFSGVAVLTYYAITNASALTLSSEHRRWPRSIAVTGLAGCVVLIVALPVAAVITGAITLTVGATIRLATTARTTPPTDATRS